MQYLLISSGFLRNPEHLLYGCGSHRLDKIVPSLRCLLSGPCGSYGLYCNLEIFLITALDHVGHLEARRGPLCPRTAILGRRPAFAVVKNSLIPLWIRLVRPRLHYSYRISQKQMQAQKSKDAVKDRGDLYDKIRNYFMQRLMVGAIIKQYIPAKTATYMFSAFY